MTPGSVVVDVAVDQGGCIETCQPTTHDHPTYVVHGVVHYCVANMPGAVPQTSTFALTNATRPYARQIADLGLAEAVQPGQGARPRAQHLRRHRSPTRPSPGTWATPTCPIWSRRWRAAEVAGASPGSLPTSRERVAEYAPAIGDALSAWGRQV